MEKIEIMFELHEEARPRNMLLIKGEIKDVEGDKIEAIVQIQTPL